MKKIVAIVVVLVLIGALLGGAGYGYMRYKEYKKYEPLRIDTERLATEDYTAVFFANYPIEHFLEEDYNYYRDIYPVIGKYTIPDLETMQAYFANVDAAGNEVETVYLGVRPDLISAMDLMDLMTGWEEKFFEVVIAYPSLEYWKGLEPEEYAKQLAAYEDFIYDLMPLYEDTDNEWIQSHFNLYFYGSTEWLVGNPANYESEFGVNEGISHMLSMYTDTEHGYLLTLDNYEDELLKFKNLIAASRGEEIELLQIDEEVMEDFVFLSAEEYPDLSKWDVVFFGDSIIAFEETSSIPGAFEGFTKAHVYNCAKGGSAAFSLPTVVDALVSKDLSNIEENTVVHKGLTDYLEHSKKKRQKCFIIDFGMNDYYSGHAVMNENDPYDTNTYAGALRVGIEKLQEAYPDAVIIMMTPNFTSYFSNGLEPQGELGSVLPDYVATVLTIGYEKDIPVYDDYFELGIDGENWTDYLLDGCHPNEITRYQMASDLAKMMADYVTDKQ